ncbi:MAG: phosphate signaling complex protein PhoU [Anaerolineales bacterium]|nr:phosphate signaling complex protein PhoU [Anaerolineales bacterium]
MHPREKFVTDLQWLSDNVLLMIDKVHHQMELALAAYDLLDPSTQGLVSELDQQVNSLRFEIEDKCVELIAMQQPAARDLRLIVAVMNMIVDLERMGDQAKGVMKALKHMHTRPMENRPPEIHKMGEAVLVMLDSTRNAYVNNDMALAATTAGADEEVDKLYAKAFTQVMFRMADAQTPEQIEAEYELLRVAREFERFGDLVTNVAERLIFLATGRMKELNTDPAPAD